MKSTKPKAKPKPKTKAKAAKTTQKKPVGRPLTYTMQKSEAILEHISGGLSATQAAKKEGIEPQCFFSWLADCRNGLPRDDISVRFARALESGCHAIAHGLVEVLDTAPGINPMTGAVDSGEVGNRRLQFEGKMRLLGKWLPKVYGEKIDVSGELKVGIAEAMREARERAKRRD